MQRFLGISKDYKSQWVRVTSNQKSDRGSREKPGRQTGGRTGRVGSFIYSADNGSHWEQNLVSQDFLARVTLREMHGREARRGQGSGEKRQAMLGGQRRAR